MDYTLAMYYSERFESLSARGALEKLVHNLGYPKALLDTEYDHSFFIRGLVVDKARGNILKLDRHKYVKRALHGFRPLTKHERASVYDAITTSGGGFSEPHFAVLDTIFSLPDAFLFSTLVEYKDMNPSQITQDYAQIYRDVRKSVDMCHRDGYIKDCVTKDPTKYIERDEAMVPMLKRLRRSGRQVFLLTNSLYDYTDAVMRYLYAGPDAPPEESAKWIDLFDIIISGSCKPAFILDRNRPLYRCDPGTGLLSNTEGVYNETPQAYLARGKCFQGGNYTHLHALLGVNSGTKVLYVGDHIYSDVLRSKRTLGWRTMLVIPELEHEINVLWDSKTLALFDRIESLRVERDSIDEWVDRLHGELVESEDLHADLRSIAELKRELQKAKLESERVRSQLVEDLEQYHKLFHPVWGQLFKTGMQNSRFAEQVENYACLYTNKVTNIGLVSPEMYWRAMTDLMPHDRITSAPMHRLLSHRRRA